MDEKRRLPLHHPRGAAVAAERSAPVRRRRTRLWLPILALVLIGYSLLSTYSVDVRGRLDKLSHEAKASAAKAVGKHKVPLEAHIISKCPDTRVCILDPAPQPRRHSNDFATGCSATAAPSCHAAGVRQGRL